MPAVLSSPCPSAYSPSLHHTTPNPPPPFTSPLPPSLSCKIQGIVALSSPGVSCPLCPRFFREPFLLRTIRQDPPPALLLLGTARPFTPGLLRSLARSPACWPRPGRPVRRVTRISIQSGGARRCCGVVVGSGIVVAVVASLRTPSRRLSVSPVHHPLPPRPTSSCSIFYPPFLAGVQQQQASISSSSSSRVSRMQQRRDR